MKTQTNNLVFKTVSILELDNKMLKNINGGSSPGCLPLSVFTILTITKE